MKLVNKDNKSKKLVFKSFVRALPLFMVIASIGLITMAVLITAFSMSVVFGLFVIGIILMLMAMLIVALRQ